MKLATAIEPGDKVKLAEIDTEPSAHLDEEAAKEQVLKLSAELGRLQELLYAARLNAVLIILQGMDTSGKDGTIKHVLAEVNPQGCRVEPFKVPTEEELSHDFLWRVHKVTPAFGMLSIFNRSHYEDVLVARVRELVPKEVWKPRYDHINSFERQLAESGTIILKFYLHISRKEQKERLEARERNTEKAWKLSVGDWQERRLWDDYIRAYEDAIERCATDHAPWHIIPADKKWFRNLAVADTIVQTLKPYRERWEQSLEELSERRLAELTLMRDELKK
jgi:PPK2 family polyphosphate:nucleotide phosphotransferase